MSEIAPTEDIHSRIARAQTKPSITQVLDRMRPDIAQALPKGLDPDRVARLALTVIRQSEVAKARGTAKTSLADCTPESFVGALLTAVALGLEPGVAGEAWLIPYGREATFVPGYLGFCKLFWQHPLARQLDAQAVYERDQFDFELGLHPYLAHKPARGDRGKITHYYAVASLATGAEKFEVMTAEEVAAVRDASPRRSNDIRDPQHWMERKTVLKQLLKLMPKSTRLQYAINADERTGTDLSADRLPAEIMAAAPPAIESLAEPPAATVPHVPYSGNSPVDPEPDEGVDPWTGEVLEPEPPAPPPTKKAAPPTPPQRGRGDQGRITVEQRSALTNKWTRLQMMGDREERMLVTCLLLGLEPGSVEDTSKLSNAQATQLLKALAKVNSRDELDQLVAGQDSL